MRGFFYSAFGTWNFFVIVSITPISGGKCPEDETLHHWYIRVGFIRGRVAPGTHQALNVLCTRNHGPREDSSLFFANLHQSGECKICLFSGSSRFQSYLNFIPVVNKLNEWGVATYIEGTNCFLKRHQRARAHHIILSNCTAALASRSIVSNCGGFITNGFIVCRD